MSNLPNTRPTDGESSESLESLVGRVADEFIEIAVKRAKKLKPGGEPNANLGPITMPSQVEIIREHVQDALDRGGKALVGGPESIRPPYVEPVVLTDVPANSRPSAICCCVRLVQCTFSRIGSPAV